MAKLRFFRLVSRQNPPAQKIDKLILHCTSWAETTFRTTDHRTLIGQSLAGLLATEVLLKHPGYYNDYIIISPSLWWDREGLYQRMDSLVSTLTDLPQRVFLSAGTEYPIMVNGSRKLAQLLENQVDATFLHLPNEDHNTILHEALNQAFDQWYDPTVIRPYFYANAWDGLNIRKGPSLDSAVVGKLAYGQSLGIISADEENMAVINELAGKWIYIGSDIGRGWVFDAYVSPVRVLRENETITNFAAGKLMLTDSLFYANHREEDEGFRLHIRKDANGNQVVRHNHWENCLSELRLVGLTEGQARVTTKNWLRSRGRDVQLLSSRPHYSDVLGLEFYNEEIETDDETDWTYLNITYVREVLSIKESCPD